MRDGQPDSVSSTTAADQNPARRSIRSFVLREGRLTVGQERAFETLWPSYGVDYTGEKLSLDQIFPRSQPVTLEVGFGSGESLAQMAAADPERNFLGVEVHRPGVGRLLLRCEELQLTNLRVMRHDAMELLARALAEASIERFLLYFPDPWHKKRHHKRRFLRPQTLDQIARVLRPGGLFHAATDWPDYAQAMLALLNADSGNFVNCDPAGGCLPRPDWRPQTRFERRGLALGHPVCDLLFRRIS